MLPLIYIILGGSAVAKGRGGNSYPPAREDFRPTPSSITPKNASERLLSPPAVSYYYVISWQNQMSQLTHSAGPIICF
eukprot:scaffold139737_cov25-Prasinocladus_malaysianus.AAC.1